MYVVYINLLYFCRFFCLLTIKIFFPKKKVTNSDLDYIHLQPHNSCNKSHIVVPKYY